MTPVRDAEGDRWVELGSDSWASPSERCMCSLEAGRWSLPAPL